MYELALFAGAGGGILTGQLLGWRTVCAVENNPYAASVLVSRQNDGSLPPFPIWDDIRTFDGTPWRSLVDVVSGGFPCQPFSTAPRGRNVAEDLWPEMFRVVDEVRPRFVFAENVLERPIERAMRDMRTLGYECRSIALDAAELGAAHKRPRWWMVAYTNSKSKSYCPVNGQVACLCGLPEMAPWKTEPYALGVDDGVANRMDRLRALGNGQVPLVAATAWHILKP